MAGFVQLAMEMAYSAFEVMALIWTAISRATLEAGGVWLPIIVALGFDRVTRARVVWKDLSGLWSSMNLTFDSHVSALSAGICASVVECEECRLRKLDESQEEQARWYHLSREASALTLRNPITGWLWKRRNRDRIVGLYGRDEAYRILEFGDFPVLYGFRQSEERWVSDGRNGYCGHYEAVGEVAKQQWEDGYLEGVMTAKQKHAGYDYYLKEKDRPGSGNFSRYDIALIRMMSGR